MSLASGSRVVESILVTRSPRLARKKQQRPWQSLHLQPRSTHHHSSSMRLSAYRCEVGSFRNVKGTKWLVVWAEQEGGNEIEQPEDKSPPSSSKIHCQNPSSVGQSNPSLACLLEDSLFQLRLNVPHRELSGCYVHMISHQLGEGGILGKVVSMGTAVQIFFAAMIYIIIFFGASVGDGNFTGRRGPPRR